MRIFFLKSFIKYKINIYLKNQIRMRIQLISQENISLILNTFETFWHRDGNRLETFDETENRVYWSYIPIAEEIWVRVFPLGKLEAK